MIQPRCQFQHVHGDLDVHIAFYAAVALCVRKAFGRLGNGGKTIVAEPVDKWPHGRELFTLDNRRVIAGSYKYGLAAEELEQGLEIEVDP